MEVVMSFIQRYWDLFINLIRQFTFRDAIDVLVVSFIIYSGIKLVRESRAEQLVKGLLLVVVVFFLANTLQLYMLREILMLFFQFAFVAVLIVFQPELRRALEQMGRNGLSKPLSLASAPKDVEEEIKSQRKGINAAADACIILQRQKMGALIVFERKTKLKEIVDTGTVVDADPSAPLIGNIFFNKAPLHDGAMVMREGRVHAAGCILPLTKNDSISVDLGTRHRAAIGMSENSDAVVVVVSEETGQISIAVNGVLTRNYTRETLANTLERLTLPESGTEKKRSGIFSVRRRGKKE